MSQMKHYLSLVLTNNFIANMKIAFTCWKMSSLRATLHIRQSAYAIKTKQLAQLEKHSVKLAEKNKLYLEKKRNDILLRKVLGALSSYTCRKKCNN